MSSYPDPFNTKAGQEVSWVGGSGGQRGQRDQVITLLKPGEYLERVAEDEDEDDREGDASQADLEEGVELPKPGATSLRRSWPSAVLRTVLTPT